jgi:hypothetical protein
MSNTITAPSAKNPIYIGFSVEVPEGWQESIIPDTIFSTKKKDENFSPNIICKFLRAEKDVTLSNQSALIGKYVNSLDKAEIITDEIGNINGQDFHIMEFVYDHSEASAIFNVIATAVVNFDEYSDIYRFIGSALPSKVDDMKELRRIVASINFAE